IFQKRMLINELYSTINDMFSDIQHKPGKETQRPILLLARGNEYFMNSNYTQALRYYNQAILHSSQIEKKVSVLSFCLANRSAVFYHLKRFNDCIQDIDDAIKFCYPVERLPKLLCRKSLCLKYLGNESEARLCLEQGEKLLTDFVKDDSIKEKMIKYISDHISEKHQIPSTINDEIKIPNIQENEMLASACVNVQIGFDQAKGRTILAKEAMKIGDIVVCEKPYVSWLRPSLYSDYCYNCLKATNERILPCQSCCVVRFCSLKCFEECWSQYHSIECRCLEALNFLSIGHLALKILFISGVEELIRAKKQGLLPLANWQDAIFLRDYNSLYSLLGSGKNFSGEQIAVFTVIAAAATVVAEKMSLISRYEEDYFKIGGLLLRHLFQIMSNSFAIYDTDVKNFGKYGILSQNETALRIGVGLYTTSSLLNHSCDNNAFKMFIDSRVLIVTKRDVPQNEEVCIEYGTTIMKDTYHDRQKYLKSNFNFKCVCNACKIKYDNTCLAYKCPKCSGPLIHNRNGKNYCAHCNQINFDLKSFSETKAEAQKNFDSASIEMKTNNYKKAISFLKTSHKLMAKIFYSNVQYENVIDALCVCYSAKNKYKEAIKLSKEHIEIMQIVYGLESFEAVNSIMRTADLLIRNAKARTFLSVESLREEAKSYFKDGLKSFFKIVDREVKIAANSKLAFVEDIPENAACLKLEVAFQ
ncbi:SET and MYND domain-containing protein 4-like protein, partial [Dinothrombium tinctorium]